MARLCIFCQYFPLLCSKCSVPLPRYRGRRWPVRASDRGLCLGRLVDGQAKGRPRTSLLHRLQYVQ